MKNSIFFNSKTLDVLKRYSEKRIKYINKGIKKPPYIIMKELENENKDL